MYLYEHFMNNSSKCEKGVLHGEKTPSKSEII